MLIGTDLSPCNVRALGSPAELPGKTFHKRLRKKEIKLISE